MSGIEPILIGAAVGAGTSAIMGGDPLTGAALGGVGGGLFGPGAGAAGGAKGGAASGLNVAPQVTAGAGGTTTFFGGPAAAFSAPTYFNPSYTSLGGLINPTDISGIKQYLPSGQAIGNLGLNAASQSMMRQPQYISAPAGGISQGKPLDIAAVENLVSKRRAQVSQTPGLMGNYFG